MLCDICQKREATRHETYCTGTADDVPKQRHLCDECFAASSPAEARELAEALQAGCKFCGGEPYTGGGSSVGPAKISFMCKSCAEEYFRFLRQKLPGFGEPDITSEQIAEMRSRNIPGVLTNAEQHMKKWVAERDSQ